MTPTARPTVSPELAAEVSAAYQTYWQVRAEARDKESADNLRDVVRGFLALAKMQGSQAPEMKAMFNSIQLGGEGTEMRLAVAWVTRALVLALAGIGSVRFLKDFSNASRF